MSPVVRMLAGVFGGGALMLAGLLLEGGNLHSILQGTSAIIVLGGTLGFMVMAFPFSLHGMAWRVARGQAQTREEVVATERYFGAMGAAFLNFGVLGATLGLIHVMENLDRPAFIGAGIAVSFICTLYGFGLKLFVADGCRNAAASSPAPPAISENPTARTATSNQTAGRSAA